MRDLFFLVTTFLMVNFSIGWYPNADELKLIQAQPLDQRIPTALAELGYTVNVGNIIFTAPTTFRASYEKAKEFCFKYNAELPSKENFEALITQRQNDGTLLRSHTHPDNHVAEAWTSTQKGTLREFWAYDRGNHTFRGLPEKTQLEIICVIKQAD